MSKWSWKADYIEREGRRGLVELADIARVQVGPVPGDLDQSEADVHLILNAGFIYRDGRIVNTDKCEVMLPELQFQYISRFQKQPDAASRRDSL